MWSEAAQTSVGLFWMALWAFCFGYFISSLVQVYVTEKKMKEVLGQTNFKSLSLATFFGFISSSCSFAALSTTRSLFAKGAQLTPSLAFLLSSTNLVIELGIVISLFLSWPFVVAEYIGALLLIVLTALLVFLTLPKSLEEQARKKAQKKEELDSKEKKKSLDQVAERYMMEWQMVWKDVTIGFTIAGVVATFVPAEFFQSLFAGSASSNPSLAEIVWQTLVGPLAAFFTFIGSMGNIPLAAVLFDNGVSFAGVMAFIFSDLVVFPVIRIQAQYYGWKMALYISAVFLASLSLSALLLHYVFEWVEILPDSNKAASITKRHFFELDLGFFLNLAFLFVSLLFFIWNFKNQKQKKHKHQKSKSQKMLSLFTFLALTWLITGLFLSLVNNT